MNSGYLYLPRRNNPKFTIGETYPQITFPRCMYGIVFFYNFYLSRRNNPKFTIGETHPKIKFSRCMYPNIKNTHKAIVINTLLIFSFMLPSLKRN